MRRKWAVIAALQAGARAFVGVSSMTRVALPLRADPMEEDDMDAMRELFLEAVEAEGGKSAVSQLKSASLFDLNDAEFKLLMKQRLGDADYNAIFNDWRVDLDVS